MLYGIGKPQAYTKPTCLEMRNIGDVSDNAHNISFVK